MDWPGLVRRYVWDDERTPYLVPVRDLSPRQAGYEILTYTLAVAIAAGVATVVAAATGRHPLLIGYGMSVLAAAVALGLWRRPLAALWCGAAPVVAVAWLAAQAAAGLLPPAKAAVAGFVCLLWLVYARRVLAVTRRFPR